MGFTKPELTAIARKTMSKPAKYLLDNFQGIPGNTLLDFGCGRGKDVQAYNAAGFEAVGYDPFYKPEMPEGTFDVVVMTYVLNVLETPEEREEAVRLAVSKVRPGGRLALFARHPKDIERSRTSAWVKSGDGWITPKGTFQTGLTDQDLVGLCLKAGVTCVDPKFLFENVSFARALGIKHWVGDEWVN